jgi:nucleoside-triphosphatase THEP1
VDVSATRPGIREPGRLVLLTGERGAGKTTTCLRLAALARAAGLDCAGIVSPALFDGETKAGIDVQDVRTNERRRLADVDPAPAGLRLGPFRFSEESLAWASERLGRACPCQVLIVDEIGPLELELGRGWVEALCVLRRGDYGLAVAVVRPSLVAALQVRLPGRVAAVVTVSAANPDAAAELMSFAAAAAQRASGYSCPSTGDPAGEPPRDGRGRTALPPHHPSGRVRPADHLAALDDHRGH